EAHGLVQQMDRNSRYRLGVGLLRLASATRGQLEIVQEARPFLKALADEVGETANIVVLAGNETLYLDQAIGTSALQMYNWVGRRNPPHATANGRVLLAGMPEVERETLLTSLASPDGQLPALTATTVTDPSELRGILLTVVRDGFSVVTDELEVGLTAIAAPVLGGGGTVLASISVSGPTFRMPQAVVAEAAQRVVDAADKLSGRMGYQRPRLTRR
ncbi:MAG: IclR family transcriptional regulator, partial [Glaciihabitans sp.]|nr:IclR family transcriptional regulator [Glaciihabitans sp.]